MALISLTHITRRSLEYQRSNAYSNVTKTQLALRARTRYIVVSYSNGDTMTWHMNSKYHRPRVVNSMNAQSRFEVTRKDIETQEWKNSLTNSWTNTALMHFKIGSHEEDSNLAFLRN